MGACFVAIAIHPMGSAQPNLAVFRRAINTLNHHERVAGIGLNYDPSNHVVHLQVTIKTEEEERVTSKDVLFGVVAMMVSYQEALLKETETSA